MINKIIAHRGAWKEFNLQENSLASLNKAIEINCFGSECDVHLTKDLYIVVHHDYDIFGLNIETSNLSELRNQASQNGIILSTLDEFLNLIYNSQLKLFIEIKSSEIGGFTRTKLLIDVLINRYLKDNTPDSIEFILFDFDGAIYLKNKIPNYQVHYLNGDKTANQIHHYNLNGIDYHYNIYLNNLDIIFSCKSIGLKTNSWTVNDLAIAQKLSKSSIDYITTDYPKLFIENKL